MNVKPGDLAIVVNSTFSENIGKVVKVVEAGTHSTGLAAWLVEMTSSFVAAYVLAGGAAQRFPAGTNVNMPDAWLRPVSGLSDPVDVKSSILEPA